jgi:hypothetical protein
LRMWRARCSGRFMTACLSRLKESLKTRPARPLTKSTGRRTCTACCGASSASHPAAKTCKNCSLTTVTLWSTTPSAKQCEPRELLTRIWSKSRPFHKRTSTGFLSTASTWSKPPA